jgi:hypothetical protein
LAQTVGNDSGLLHLAEPRSVVEPTSKGNPVGTIDSHIAPSTGKEVARGGGDGKASPPLLKRKN